VTVNVETIPVWVPATKRALSDASQLRGIIDQEIRDDLLEEVDRLILNGNGASGEFTGIYSTSNVLGQAYSTDILTTCRKAITNLRTNGKVNPTGWVMHPNDWETIDLLKDDYGRFHRGGPFAAGPNTLWGVPVIESFNAVEKTPILGNWNKAVLWDREQTTISVSDSHEDFFIRNMVAILGELRAAFGVLKPTAFVEVSLGLS
jgi:HK97 family phage major capsid protein